MADVEAAVAEAAGLPPRRRTTGGPRSGQQELLP
jgi:hypothetical protein